MLKRASLLYSSSSVSHPSGAFSSHLNLHPRDMLEVSRRAASQLFSHVKYRLIPIRLHLSGPTLSWITWFHKTCSLFTQTILSVTFLLCQMPSDSPLCIRRVACGFDRNKYKRSIIKVNSDFQNGTGECHRA